MQKSSALRRPGFHPRIWKSGGGPSVSQSNMVSFGLMDLRPLDHRAESPLYRQLYEQIAEQIRSGRLSSGAKLPATRELAGLLGLNRTTVSAAYERLETEGLISGQVGRGSFVAGSAENRNRGVDWSALLERNEAPAAGPTSAGGREVIRFVMSSPSHALFPLD